MSSVIAKQPKDTKKQTTVSLSGSVLADLELYCRFIDSARDWVINEALKAVFRRDKAFIQWKEGPLARARRNPVSRGRLAPRKSICRSKPTESRNVRSRIAASRRTFRPLRRRSGCSAPSLKLGLPSAFY